MPEWLIVTLTLAYTVVMATSVAAWGIAGVWERMVGLLRRVVEGPQQRSITELAPPPASVSTCDHYTAEPEPVIPSGETEPVAWLCPVCTRVLSARQVETRRALRARAESQRLAREAEAAEWATLTPAERAARNEMALRREALLAQSILAPNEFRVAGRGLPDNPTAPRWEYR